MAQARYPAIDEFRGMYNGRSIFDEFETSEESGAVGEILFNSEEAKISPTMEEIKTVGEAVRGFERELAADLRAAGNPLIGYEEGSYLVPGDRTIQMLPGHYSLVNRANCDRLAKLLRERFPLWRVMIAAPGTQEVPIVYPDQVVIPTNWQSREEAYWDVLLQIGQKVYENDYARLDELKFRLIQSQIRKKQTEITSSLGIEYEILAVFEENRVVSQLPTVILDIWIRTDNSHPGICYLPKFRAAGVWGSESKYAVDKSGELKPHRFGVFTEDDHALHQRIYVFSIQADSFKGVIYLRSPEMSQDFEVRIPADAPRWRQVGDSMKLEKVER
jgi:hypothetical protein